jgi:peptidoglycan/LPS O-acetylase OafA/YrhL
MNGIAKSIGKLITVGVFACIIEFALVVIHGWPTTITITLTAVLFLVAGILAGKWNQKTRWYSGLLVALPFWLLLLTGKTSSEAVFLPYVGLVSAYLGSFISSRLNPKQSLRKIE